MREDLLGKQVILGWKIVTGVDVQTNFCQAAPKGSVPQHQKTPRNLKEPATGTMLEVVGEELSTFLELFVQLAMKVSVLIMQELQEFQESLGRNNATHVSVILMEMLSVQKYFVTMMMMLWKFVLTVRVNQEFLENHGKKTATLVGVQVLELLCVVRVNQEFL